MRLFKATLEAKGYLHFYATEYLNVTRVSDVLHNWALMFPLNDLRPDPTKRHLENLRGVNFYCTPAFPVMVERRIYKRNPVPEDTGAGKMGLMEIEYYLPGSTFALHILSRDGSPPSKLVHFGKKFRLDALEKRRTLARYQLGTGQRRFYVWLESGKLGLSGKLDLLIVSARGFFPVDFKYTRGRPRRNHLFQLAAYAMLVEENFQTEVGTGFIYLAPVQEVVAVRLTQDLKEKTVGFLARIRQMIRDGILPTATTVRSRCDECEYRNYCGDIF